MIEEDIFVRLDILTDLELVDLYSDGLAHIDYLNKSVIELESEGTDNGENNNNK